ncbi:MAG: DUF937 domain-containing protein [Lachnospiraceae bacterium]|nr:DUF937 domain-containing protein [Lachnospiraceae bacterium]
MNLLQMLLGSLTSSSSLNVLSQNTGTSSQQTASLLNSAVPTLLGALTNNASSAEGAQSLLNALGQHTETSSMAQQLANADTNDGNLIIQHILGNNTGNVVQSLAGQSGASENQVSSLLSTIAPALMSGLSAATTQAHSNTSGSGLDFSSLLTSFSGAEDEPVEQESSGGLLGSLFGGGSNSGNQGGLLGGGSNSGGQGLSLFGNNNSGNTGASQGGGLFGGIGNLLSSLFRSSDDGEEEEQDEAAFDGTNLLSSLLNRMPQE